jgi:hypothetical protein
MSALPQFREPPRPLPAAANAPMPTAGSDPAASGILLACPVARGGLLLFGWHAARLPRQGSARSHGHGFAGDGPYRLHAWRRDEHGTAWFIAAVQLRDPRAMMPAAEVVLRATGRPDIALGALPAGACAPEALADRLVAEANAQAGPLALFLADLAIAAPRSAALRVLLRGFLARTAEDDGVIEIVGQGQSTIMLQGWGGAFSGEAPTALLTDDGVTRHELNEAAFARTDIRVPDRGSVLLLATAQGIDAGAITTVHIADGAALRRRRILPGRTLLGSAELAMHLRDTLPRLSCGPETQAAITQLLRPRYAGQETLSSLDRPVRAAIDVAVALPGAGAYLCGWLIDPRQHVRGVMLGSGSGQQLRLDDRWTRLPRPDVVDAFRADPRFAVQDSGVRHGFAVFAPGMPGEGLHLDIDLGDTAAFLPVEPTRSTPRALLRRALESLDLHQPGARAAIAAQLGPMLRAALHHGISPPIAETHRTALRAAPCALLLPLSALAAPPQSDLSFLLADRLGPDEMLVLVAPSRWDDVALAALDRALDLYGLDATVLRANESCEWTEALDIAARATEATTLLCLGPGIVGATPGWRHALYAQLASMPAAAVAFPTTLYEDSAVRSIGVSAIERLQAPPWSRVRRPLAGHPAAGIIEPCQRLAAGSLGGAAVSRAAWHAAGGFAGGGILATAQEIAFFARLSRAGGCFMHSAAVQVFAPGSIASVPARWRQAAELADGWLMAETHAAREAA